MNVPKRYLMIPRDYLPAERVAILWCSTSSVDNPEEPGRVFNVRVMRYPEDTCGEALQWWDASSGACYTDWLFKNGVAPTEQYQGGALLSPEGTFGLLASQGFKDTQEFQNAIIQFARISSCHWAQAMLYCFSRKQEHDVTEEADRRWGEHCRQVIEREKQAKREHEAAVARKQEVPHG